MLDPNVTCNRRYFGAWIHHSLYTESTAPKLVLQFAYVLLIDDDDDDDDDGDNDDDDNNNNNNNNVPVTKDPIGLFRSDGNRPDGLTLVLWQSGKSLCWDVTVSCPLAESYVSEAAREAGAAAELAATRKEVKYAVIVGRHMFEPIAVETLGVFNASAVRLLNDLGRRISSISGDTRETSHLY